MNRLFHSGAPRGAGYVGLALFVIAYLAIVTLLVAPGLVTTGSQPHVVRAD